MLQILNEKYNLIGNVILDNVEQISWEKVVIRIKKDSNNNSMGIYFKTDGEYHIDGDLVKQGILDEMNSDMMLIQIDDIADEIVNVFIDNKQDVWTEMVYVLDENNKINVSYGYEPLDEDILKDNIIWSYKNLGIKPDDAHMEYIEDIQVEII